MRRIIIIAQNNKGYNGQHFDAPGEITQQLLGEAIHQTISHPTMITESGETNLDDLVVTIHFYPQQ